MLIPECDVYSLIIGSKLPFAIKFKKFVFKEVLPSLRRHGTYPPPDEQTQRLAIGYNIGVHEDRMKHFDTLDDEQRKDMRKETLTETNTLKSEHHMEMGGRGGTSTQKKWRDLKRKHDEL